MSTQNKVYLGEQEAAFEAQEVKGELVSIGKENYYKISNVNEMRPFLMSILSNANHWMFLTSNGGLTAGRKDSNNAIFPYTTDDKIIKSSENTGSKTIIQIHQNNKTILWEPLSNKYEGIYKISRNLYKSTFGNKVIFEEINHNLNLTFQYEWNSSNKFGFIKKSTLINNADKAIKVTVLDGIQNIVPYGVSSDLQNATSNLVDAYKRSELDKEVGLGIFALSAIIVDKAEPSEALKANIVWSVGVEKPIYLLSSLQLDNFRKGKPLQQEEDVKAEKGAYFTNSTITLKAQEKKSWFLIANVNQTMVSINEIKEILKKEKNIINVLLDDVNSGTKNLLELAGASDGMQLTADKLLNTRHFSNTLFNIMRGGIFDNNYQIEKNDFSKYLCKANKTVYENKKEVINKMPELFDIYKLKSIADASDDADFKRLSLEYLPLKFSRRHGDPSRPWNKFSINTQSEIDGSKILDYEGNWRDIFQNWEALAYSYPEFIESMIHKFLNASTFDGYNPYRVTKDGFDWETIDPSDPWSFIGYWGDHQIIYLLKFLEFSEKHFPDKLANYFDKKLFVYANVPYKIKKYADILKNPKDTIEFDVELDEKINKKKQNIGADGALLSANKENIYKVNLIEKLLATVLAKVSNFIPEAGIWMNTQRPEWNDANNALVGNGVSMVTLYYLHRFLTFLNKTVENSAAQQHEISEELLVFFNKIVTTFQQNEKLLAGKISDKDRKTILDSLGNAGSEYRTRIYNEGFSSKKATISKANLQNFFDIVSKFMIHAIKANKRSDNLYHAYNLMTIKNKQEVSISYLPEMLEGQVAVLSSGYLNASESLELLNALKWSALFRRDQYSYLLYPNKELPGFEERNNIPAEKVEKSALLKQLLKEGNTSIIEKDILGNYHFNGNFNNANSLKNALVQLSADKYKLLIEKEQPLLLDIFEEIFNHKAFTGRSGTFYGYEGLGSIYWHMVSKLLLAVQETCLAAVDNNENDVLIGKLLDHYYEINEGIGVHKSPQLYGAFPTDPYSHTPAGKGAQQPGMTGQVKEDILSRFGELGAFVNKGKLMFNPRLLRGEEFLKEPKLFLYVDLDKNKKQLKLEKESLAFTYCQIPVIYKLSNKNELKVVFNSGEVKELQGLSLDANLSSKIFKRTGEVVQLEVHLKK